jgi:endonuclease/exonuclease/phosphatase family metal-dependent hydrolase
MAATVLVRPSATGRMRGVDPRTLTVATYNLYLGADLARLFAVTSLEQLADEVEVLREQLARTRFTERAAAVARILAREEVDVVGLQEVTRWSLTPLAATDRATGEPGPEQVLEDFLPVLLDALAAAGTPYDVHAADRGFGGSLPVHDGVMSVAGSDAVLVRRGGAFRVTGERTGVYAASHAVRTGIDGVSFPIRRGWGIVAGEVDGSLVVVANTHTEAYDAAARDAQRDELLAELSDVDAPVVLLGDLNATPDVVGVPDPFDDAWLAAGGDPEGGHTCGQDADLANPVSSLGERIDYVLVRGARVDQCRVVGADDADRTEPHRLWPSDHAGVVARLGWNA